MTSVFAQESILWDNGQILDYSFFGGSPKQHAKVDNVIQEWTWYANITFEKSTPKNSTATLRITFDPNNGSWSCIGTSAKDRVGPAPTINLGWIGDNDTTTEREHGITLHEFGHVIGLRHEHQSPARSSKIHLKEKETIKYYTNDQGWDKNTQLRNEVLDMYREDLLSNFSSFDPTSIMMYAMPGLTNDAGLDILEVTQLSMLDKAFAILTYSRIKVHALASQWTPKYALTVVDVHEDVVTAYCAATNIGGKRAIFAHAIAEKRALEARTKTIPSASKAPFNAPVCGYASLQARIGFLKWM